MNLNLSKFKENNIRSYFYYSLLLLPSFINIFKIQVNFIYLIILVFFAISEKKLFQFKNVNLLPTLVELLVISYSFYFVPKIIRYILLIISLLKIYFEFLRPKIKLNFKLTIEQILIIILISIYPLLNTFINDIYINQEFSPVGYIRILRTFLFIIIGLFTFQKYNNLNIIIRPIFVSALMHAVINIGYFLDLTNNYYLRFFSIENNFIVKQGLESFQLGFFRSNALLLFLVPIIYYLYKRNFIAFFISYFAIVITESRAGFILSTIGFFIWIICNIYVSIFEKKRKTIFYYFIILFISIYLIIGFNFTRKLFNLLELNSNGISGLEIRFEYIRYYLDNISFPRFIFGFGNNFEIYNSYRNIYDKTEVSQLNYLYYSGFLNSFLFYLLYFKLIITNLFKRTKENISILNIKIFSIILIYIFIVSLSQEFLFHPINILMLVFISFNEIGLDSSRKKLKEIK